MFDIDVKYIGDDMCIKVFDEQISSNDATGACQMKLSSLCVQGGLDEWFPIVYKGKSAGQVHLRSQWFPTAKALAKKEALKEKTSEKNETDIVELSRAVLEQKLTSGLKQLLD